MHKHHHQAPSAAPRILIVSSVLPAEGRGGGCLALYRHFVLRHDFRVLAAGPQLEKVTQVETLPLDHGRLLSRLRRTRFHRAALNAVSLLQWQVLPAGILDFARRWKPDLIFNVPDHLTSGWAWQLSRKLGIPLAVNFQDLFPLMSGHLGKDGLYPPVIKYHLQRFHFLNEMADVVFYTSEGMRDWLGAADNGHVLYPLGANPPSISFPPSPPPQARPLQLVYAGNCYGPYGRMMLALARHLQSCPDIRLSIFTQGNDWPEADVRYFQEKGVLCGERSVEALQTELLAADAFLTVMSFEPERQVFNQTSFTTKWLDYAPYGKPVFVWAPPQASASLFAEQHQCAVVTSTPAPQDLEHSIRRTSRNSEEWLRLSNASLRLSQTILHADRIHDLLKRELYRLCS